jgi:Xaa-Pro aminopeptidase
MATVLPTTTYIHRLSGLQERLKEKNIDVAVICDPDSVCYFSGFWNYLGTEFGRPTILVVPRGEAPILITPLMESEMARRMSAVDDVRPWADGVDNEWRGDLAKLLGSRQVRCVAIERKLVPPLISVDLQQMLDQRQTVDLGPIIADLRRIKSPEEISLMRKAGAVAVAMVQGARGAIADGVPEYEVALAVLSAGTRKAAEFLDPEADRFMSPTIYNLQIMQSGRDTCMVHRRSSTKRLERGDPVYLCFCGIANFANFKLGFDREFFVGSVTNEQASIYETTVKAQQAALSQLRPGIRCEEVNSAAEAVYRDAGFSPGYRTGRSIGYSFLEAPELKRGDSTIIEAGMTFAVDGGITIKGQFGGRIGDSVVVTDTGFEYLTPYPRELTVL